MNKKDKEEVAMCKKLIKSLVKGYGKPCPELNIDCAVCKTTLLVSLLEWHISNVEWGSKFENSKVVKTLNKIKETIKNGTIKKSKAIGKF